MKRQLSFFFVIISIYSFSQAIISIPDTNLKSKLIFSTSSDRVAKNLSGQWIKVDANSDLQIQLTEAMQVGSLFLRGSNISSLEGIKFFSNLKNLDVFSNNLINLDLTSNSLLKTLICDNNKLTNLNIDKNSNLNYLSASWNKLSNVVLPVNIEVIYITNNQLLNIDLTNNTKIKILRLENNPLSALNLSNILNLEELNFSSTNISEIDLTKNFTLKKIVNVSSKLNFLDVSENSNLETLHAQGLDLVKIDIRNNNNSQILDATFGDVSTSPKLKCVFVDWKDSYILTRFWLKPYTANYVENESECNALLNTDEISKNVALIYPNPVSDFLNVSPFNYKRYEIVNYNGKVIKYGAILDNKIDVKILPVGTYFLKLYSGNKFITKPFIKY